MAEKFYIKQHDLLPHLKMRLQDDGIPVDLTNATSITFLMRNRRAGLKVSANMFIHPQDVDDTKGVVSYRWAPGDTDVAGEFNGEIQVNWPASLPQTFPAHSYFIIAIEKDLGGNPPPPLVGP